MRSSRTARYGVAAGLLAAFLGIAYFLYMEKNAAAPALTTDRALTQRWNTIFAKKSTHDAYAEFLKAGGNMPYYEAHGLSHVVGAILYERLGEKGMSACTADFGFGCYHGFVGAALAARGLADVGLLTDACATVSDAHTAFGCVHGLGHGILAYVGNDRLEDALERCEPINARWGSSVGGCYGGVFMEYNYNTMRSADGVELRPYDPARFDEPCRDIDGRFGPACYYELPSWWQAWLDDASTTKAQQFAEIGARCERSDDQQLRRACFRGVGNVVGALGGGNAETMLSWCGTQPAAGRGLCRIEALGHLFETEEGRGRIKALCESGVVSDIQICDPAHNARL